MSLDNVGSNLFKPILRLLGTVIVPSITTVILWNTMDNLVTILAIVLLATLILKQWGANVKILTRFANTRIGKTLMLLVRSGSMITKINEEYFEETSEIIAEGTKIVVKKIKEEIQMNKIKAFQEASYIWLKHNKKQVLGYLALILLSADVYFGISQRYGLPPDAANWIAGLIFTIVLAVMGGEGFTSNLINRVRENKNIAKSVANAKTKKYKIKLDDVNQEIKAILKRYGVDDILPEAMKPDYTKLMNTKREYEEKIKGILEELEKRTTE